jgi:hypothetical protein
MKLAKSQFDILNIVHKNGQCTLTLKDCNDLKVIFNALNYLDSPKSIALARLIYKHLLTLVTDEQMKATQLSREEVVTAFLIGYYEEGKGKDKSGRFYI